METPTFLDEQSVPRCSKSSGLPDSELSEAVILLRQKWQPLYYQALALCVIFGTSIAPIHDWTGFFRKE
jgi:hypothetical protein